MILRLLPLLLIIAYSFLMMRFSIWQTKRMLDRQSRPLEEPRLREVTAKLAAALGVEEIKVYELDLDLVNGLAAPDGRIFLTKGFLRKLQEGVVTPEELASVIAHEMGHVAHGHSRRRMIDFTGQNAMVVMLAGVLNRFVPVIGGYIAAFISRLLMAHLSRRDEFEADTWATALMLKAGFGAAPQTSLFRKLDGLVGADQAGPPVWLRSHPKSAERIAAIESNVARWQAEVARPS